MVKYERVWRIEERLGSGYVLQQMYRIKVKRTAEKSELGPVVENGSYNHRIKHITQIVENGEEFANHANQLLDDD